MLFMPLLAMAIAAGCSEGDSTCLFGCECLNAADCEDGKECTRNQCQQLDGVLMCVFPPEQRGVSCRSDGGRVCDGDGNCVDCNETSDCPDDGDACTVATCKQQSCGVEIVNCPPVLTGSSHELIRVNETVLCNNVTLYDLIVEYEDVNGDVTQDGTRVFIDYLYSDGLTGSLEVQSFTVRGSGFSGSVEIGLCIGFGLAEWVDETARIWDAAGNESNPQTERIPRPPGAN